MAKKTTQEVDQEVTTEAMPETEAPTEEITRDMMQEVIDFVILPTFKSIKDLKRTGRLSLSFDFKEGMIGQNYTNSFFTMN